MSLIIEDNQETFDSTPSSKFLTIMLRFILFVVCFATGYTVGQHTETEKIQQNGYIAIERFDSLLVVNKQANNRADSIGKWLDFEQKQSAVESFKRDRMVEALYKNGIYRW